MIFELIIAIVFSSYLQKTLHTATEFPKSDRLLVLIRNGAIVLMVVSFVIKAFDPVIPWLTHALLLYFVYLLYHEKEFSNARPVLLAVAPFILLSIITDVLRLTDTNQYNTWKDLIKLAYVFSGIWLVVFWFNTRRQKKALEKEQKRTKDEIEQKKVLATMKESLEIQVAERTAELTKQKEELEHTVEELKSTQALLIQSEKMASLGELTAGIAHEIQNPLNFVNNFAEVNGELIDEIVQEIQAGNKEEALHIAKDIRENEQKISYHGKRAEAIVKGMLQHSRTSSGLKEPVNINELADEYLRLSYHGLRSKDNSLVASIKTEFDPSLAKINIIEQDIGRVLLNLYNNAFYAVTERRKTLLQNQPEGVKLAYEPAVTVKTQRRMGKVEITVTDNGNGIPERILDKIFQPFFTTKPTGQGTGLGLSLSYDIVKAHGGELTVKTKEVQDDDPPGTQPFTKFTILLPVV